MRDILARTSSYLMFPGATELLITLQTKACRVLLFGTISYYSRQEHYNTTPAVWSEYLSVYMDILGWLSFIHFIQGNIES